MTKKYKLKKWYPSLPQDWVVGMEIAQGDRGSYGNYSPCSGAYKDYYIVPEIVERNPEFWEEIVEKDYEILSFRSKTFSQRIANVDNGIVLNTGVLGLNPSLEHVLCWVELGNWDIYSVKRLSDGEVFTVGDKVINVCNNKITTIKEFNNSALKTVGKMSAFYEDGTFDYLKDVKKAKTPLFTTEDGVDIYEGDKYWVVGIDFTIHYHNIAGKGSGTAKTAKYFSTKEAAEEYILYNKPCLSINDVAKFYTTANRKDSIYSQPKKLKELVKSRL